MARRCALLLSAGSIAAAVLGPTTFALAAWPQVGARCRNLPPGALTRSVPWAQRALDFQRVWPITEGAGVLVAVVDTGVDGSQPFLAGAVLRGLDVINGGGPANTDCDGHGTFVAGIIAARPRSGLGFAGVAPQARILPIRQANSTTDGTARSLAEGIVAAVNDHAQVINVSIVTAVPTPGLVAAVRYALAHNVVIVAAAGNDYTQGNAIQYPAGLPGVLAVGAVDASGQRAGFSETGPDISVVAPGTDLLGPSAGGAGLVTMAGGTSFAAPFVAGVAALIRSYYPNLTAAQVVDRIEATADHPPGPLPAVGLGWGMVDPYAAVTAALPGAGTSSARPRSHVSLPRPAVAAAGAAGLAATVGVIGALLAVGILLAAGVVRRAAHRGWRPGRVGADRPGT